MMVLRSARYGYENGRIRQSEGSLISSMLDKTSGILAVATSYIHEINLVYNIIISILIKYIVIFI